MATLQALSDNVVAHIYEIAEPTFAIGRSHSNHLWDIFGSDDKVSRFQAQIDKVGGDFILTDKGHNPTFLNQQPMKPTRETAVLRHGDIIEICHQWSFRFCHEGSYAASHSTTAATRDLPESPEASSVESQIDVDSDGSSTQNTTSAAIRLKALAAMLSALGKTLDLADQLTGLFQEVLKVFTTADTCLVGLRQEDGSMHVVAELGRSPGASRPHLSRTIAAEVVRTKKAILFSDRSQDPIVTGDSIRALGVRTAMSVPLQSEGEVIGVMQIDTRRPGERFRKDDLEVLASIAPPVSLAVLNSQLLERLVHQRTMEYELTAAKKVQMSFLPSQKPVIPGYEFYSYYNAALLVGGDYHDYIQLPDGRLAVVIADAAGKGTSAALFMAAVSGELKCALLTESSAAAALGKLNRCLCEKPESRFVTMALTVLDPVSHRVTILNAGHFAPLHRQGDGTITEAGAAHSGLALGVEPDSTYRESHFSLAPGESLIMYTDGFPDALNKRGQQYSRKRVLQLAGSPAPNLSELGLKMVRDAHDFMGTHPQYDDMCLSCLGREAAKH